MRKSHLLYPSWSKLSLEEQLGNIGSEISRALRWQGRDQKLFAGAVDRALELFDLTLEDPRWKGRRIEVARSREIFCDVVFGENIYDTSLNDLLRYFDQFARLVRSK